MPSSSIPKWVHMDKDTAITLGRLDRYLFRVKKSLRAGELIKALPDTAELSEIARRLSLRIEGLLKEKHKS
jgi:hypothetical protein